MDDLATLRRRLDAVARQVDGGPNGGRPGAAVRVGKVLDGGSMPATVPGMFLLKPQRIGGTESEGSALANADDGPPFVALVLGPRVPAVGDLLVARLVGGRWVAEASQPNVSPCACGLVPVAMDVLSGYRPPNYAFVLSASRPTRFTYGARPAGMPATVNAYSTPTNTYTVASTPAFSWYSDNYSSSGGQVYDQLSFFGCVATIRQYFDQPPASGDVAGTGWSTLDATLSFSPTGAVNGALATIAGCSPTANTCNPFYIGNAVYSSYTFVGSPRGSYNEGPCLQRNGSSNIALDASGNAGRV